MNYNLNSKVYKIYGNFNLHKFFKFYTYFSNKEFQIPMQVPNINLTTLNRLHVS